MDGMLLVGLINDMVVVGYGVLEFEDLLKEYFDEIGCVIVLDLNLQVGYFYCLDYVLFVKKGVFMLYVDGGIDKVDGGVVFGKVIVDMYMV